MNNRQAHVLAPRPDPAVYQWVKIPGLHPKAPNALRLLDQGELERLMDRVRDALFRLERAEERQAARRQAEQWKLVERRAFFARIHRYVVEANRRRR